MKEKKFYAVKVGKITGIFNSWKECEDQVVGFKGAMYKSFKNIEDAKEYLNKDLYIENEEKIFSKDDINEDEVFAYVDGSYKKETLEYGYGVVFLSKNEVLEFLAKGENEEVSKSRNVTGELFGAIRAISEAIVRNKKKITLFYDYQGIESWANEKWKCNLPLTIGYRNKIREFRKEIEICFVKVKAHSGDTYNERADFLAKKSLGIKK